MEERIEQIMNTAIIGLDEIEEICTVYEERGEESHILAGMVKKLTAQTRMQLDEIRGMENQV